MTPMYTKIGNKIYHDASGEIHNSGKVPESLIPAYYIAEILSNGYLTTYTDSSTLTGFTTPNYLPKKAVRS